MDDQNLLSRWQANLGFDEYRVRSLETIQTHWCLVFVAYSILHLACLPPLPTNGKCPTYPIQTVGEVCRQQGQALIEELILFAHDRLEQGRSAAQSVVDFSPTKS